MDTIIKTLKNVPSVLSGTYRSRNRYYNVFLSRFYPDDGVIKIGGLREDRRNYCKDFTNSFDYYKRASSKYLEINGKKKKAGK